jgi:tetratricopeptide (TPR) repeat protein
MPKFDFVRSAVAALVISALLTGAAGAEIPDEFTNLKVFDKDVGKRELVGAMKSYSMSLGVRCEYCHVQEIPGDFDSIAWASDDNPKKDIARGMMAMTAKLNDDLLPAALGSHTERVSCVCCHRGLSDPATLDQVLLKTIEAENVQAALAQYRDLKEGYYGMGAYNFGPMTLIGVAEKAAGEKGDIAGALEILDLNTEMNPDDAMSYLMKASIQAQSGDKDAAIANVEKVLEMEPDNRRAAHLLEQLQQ